MDIIEKYFGDGSQSSMEARVYLEDYMERVREFFVIELGGTPEALDDLSYSLSISRMSNFTSRVVRQKLFLYERNRAMFVDYAINGKSYAALGRKYRLSRNQVSVVIRKTLNRLKRAVRHHGLAKFISKDETLLALFRVAFSGKDDWSDWLEVREPRDFIYV